MKLYLIRHGQTTGDIEGRFGGNYDDHLTELGNKQAADLADKLMGKEIELILCSPRIRAKETAEYVKKKLRAPLKIVNELRERNNYGVLTGLTQEEAKEKHPVDFAKIWKDKTYHDVTASESYEDTAVRVKKVFQDIRTMKHDVLAVVAHGGVISTYVREVFGKNIKLGDCAIVEVETAGNTINCLYEAELP